MTQEIFNINLTREQLTFVQVALLEAQISASTDERQNDADRYLETYKYIGTEKRRVLTKPITQHGLEGIPSPTK